MSFFVKYKITVKYNPADSRTITKRIGKDVIKSLVKNINSIIRSEVNNGLRTGLTKENVIYRLATK